MARHCHIEGKVCLSQKESVVLFTICRDGFKGWKYQGDSHSSVVFSLQAVSMYSVVCTLCVQQCIVSTLAHFCSPFRFTWSPLAVIFLLQDPSLSSLRCQVNFHSFVEQPPHHVNNCTSSVSAKVKILNSIHVLLLFTGFFFQETFEIARRSKDQTSTSQCHAIATGLQGRIAPIQWRINTNNTCSFIYSWTSNKVMSFIKQSATTSS